MDPLHPHRPLWQDSRKLDFNTGTIRCTVFRSVLILVMHVQKEPLVFSMAMPHWETELVWQGKVGHTCLFLPSSRPAVNYGGCAPPALRPRCVKLRRDIRQPWHPCGRRDEDHQMVYDAHVHLGLECVDTSRSLGNFDRSVAQQLHSLGGSISWRHEQLHSQILHSSSWTLLLGHLATGIFRQMAVIKCTSAFEGIWRFPAVVDPAAVALR